MPQIAVQIDCFCASNPVTPFADMNLDTQVRLRIYDEVIRNGRWPRMQELADAVNATETQVRAASHRLFEGHTGIVLQEGNDELLFAAPFSAVPSSFHVEVGRRFWFAPCGWDAFGIVALLGGSGVIHTSCPCCGETMDVAIHDKMLQNAAGWMNLVVPAKRFWEDIVFT